jgi:hypothetical protein
VTAYRKGVKKLEYWIADHFAEIEKHRLMVEGVVAGTALYDAIMKLDHTVKEEPTSIWGARLLRDERVHPGHAIIANQKLKPMHVGACVMVLDDPCDECIVADVLET